MADFEGALPIKTVRDDEVKIKVVDWLGGSEATNGWSIDADGAGLVRAVALDIRSLSSVTDSIDVSDSVIKITDGTHGLAVNSDGSINVALSSGDNTSVNFYGTAAAVAKNAVSDFDYTIVIGQSFKGKFLLVGSRGACKIDYGLFDGTDFTVYGTYLQLPANNNSIAIPAILGTGDGDLKVRVRVTNYDNATDLYVTLQGVNSPV